MPIECLEIIDTAVKIGLGAAISTLSAYFLAKTNNKHEREENSRTQKLIYIDKVSENVDSFVNAQSEYIECVLTSSSLTEADANLSSKYDALTKARSQLLLLKLKKCESILHELSHAAYEANRHVIEDGRTDDNDTRIGLVNIKRDEFYSELANHYEV